MIRTVCISLFLFFNVFLHSSSYADSTSPVEVKLIHAEQSIQPGRPFWVAVQFKIQDNWHTYWKNPGDAGMPTMIQWNLPEGFTAAPVLWPTPKKFNIDTMVGYGYENEAIFVVEITPPQDLKAGNTVDLGASVRWLVCSDASCVPGEQETAAKLSVKDEVPLPHQEGAPLIAKAREELPKTSDVQYASRTSDTIDLHLQVPANFKKIEVHFYPADQQVIDHTTPATVDVSSSTPNKIKIRLKETSKSKEARTTALNGVVVIKNKEQGTVHAFDVSTPIIDPAAHTDSKIALIADASQANGQLTISSSETLEGGLAMALVLAFFGGIILNLMPCVLPVVSFKVLGFVKIAGDDRKKIFKHGLVFFGGVLISFWILAGMLVVLQAYGHSVGWGFQLQEPLFVATLAAFLFMFGLSMFGLFEMGTRLTTLAGQVEYKTKSEGLVSSFFSGVLATVVATPCTGPMLGTAIGFAATMPPYASMLIFTTMGAGMALPYLLLAVFPGLLRFMPKPGPWMDTFKELMGFMMMATVIWLAWVFGAQTSHNGIITLLTGLFILAIGGWIYGKWGSPVKTKLTRAFGIALGALCLVTGSYTIVQAASLVDSMDSTVAQNDAHATNKSDEWETFSPERVRELQKQGIPVVVDFTAKWCLICQSNHMVFMSSDVQAKMESLGVVKMKADWTRKDEMITQELKKYGRNGVPLYLVFEGKEGKEPQIMPQVLTPAIVVEYLNTLN